MARLLLVDDDPFALETLSEALTKAGHDVQTAHEASSALTRLEDERYELLVADLQIEPIGGVELLERARTMRPHLSALFTSAHTSVEDALAALRAGARDYLAKPFHVDELVRAVERALVGARVPSAVGVGPDGAPIEGEECEAEAATPPAGRGRVDFEELIGRNPRMQRIYELIRTVAPATSTVLISGESGTGKERVAAAIHRRSPRSGAPFVRVNCSAFAEGVLESELFGHVQGAFTGAVKARAGVFRRADRGTLFLDEIGDLPASTQVKLLRAIQEREVQPVGGDVALPVDVRLIAATNRDLAGEVRRGNFREDLFFRLNVIPLHLPPLRERSDDIPHLAQHFLGRFSRQCGKELEGFSERALAAMERYPWPGNVRELENAVERSVVLAAGSIIDLPDLPPELRGTRASVDGSFQLNTVRLSEVEEIVIRRVLTRTSWNIKRSAEILGITRATLYSKIKKLGLAVARG